jgi:hypothetical protein
VLFKTKGIPSYLPHISRPRVLDNEVQKQQHDAWQLTLMIGAACSVMHLRATGLRQLPQHHNPRHVSITCILFYSTMTIRPLTGGTDGVARCYRSKAPTRSQDAVAVLPHEEPALPQCYGRYPAGSRASSSLHDPNDHKLHMNTPRTTMQISIESRNHRESVRL